MSKLPNADRAIVPIEKFTEYALNPDHPSGRHKAKVFETLLGITLEDASFLRKTVQQIVTTHDSETRTPTEYGERYVIDFTLTTDKGTAIIRTGWIIRYDEDFPRLTSCYVK